MIPLETYDFVAKTTVIVGDTPNKALEAIASSNIHQKNRIKGKFLNGESVVVSQRPGKGGMDFNKLLSGKIYAVAADATSKTLETSKRNRIIQKKEDNHFLYSASGFYCLSSKDYPAIEILETYSRLSLGGDKLYSLTEEQVINRRIRALKTECDLDFLLLEIEELLSDDYNALKKYEDVSNKARKIGIAQAKLSAEINQEDYAGIEFEKLNCSKRDGAPFIVIQARFVDGTVLDCELVREQEVRDNKYGGHSQLIEAQAAVAIFHKSPFYKKVSTAVDSKEQVIIKFAQGNVYRTSPAFKKKFDAVSNSDDRYGEALYIAGAKKGWTRAIIAIMQSTHPQFPKTDYIENHYVVMCRQAEVGLNKRNGKFQPPSSIQYAF